MLIVALGTPHEMSLSRSPSPRLDGGWSSPGLSSQFGEGSGLDGPAPIHRTNGNGAHVTWEGAKKKSAIINGVAGASGGFFKRHIRNLSSNLPSFNMGSGDYSFAEKEKLGRGRWTSKDGNWQGRIRAVFGKVARKMKLRFVIVLALIFGIILFYMTRRSPATPLCDEADINSFALSVA